MHVDIDWNALLLYGVPTWIAAIGGAVAAVLGSMSRRNSKTTNGHTLGEMVEATHALATTTADAVDKLNGTTQEE